MNRLIPSFFIFFLLFGILSCQQNSGTKDWATQRQLASPDTIYLKDLADSLQPKKVLFSTHPPQVVDMHFSPIEALEAPVLNIEKFTKDDGLGNNGVPASYLDSRGYVWFGTLTGGASCFNGKEFINYTTAEGLASNIIWTIYEDKKGNMWFGTRGEGISKFDGISFTNYNSSDGLLGSHIYSFAEDDSGHLWIGSMKGLSVFDGKNFTNYTDIAELNDNLIISIINIGGGKMCLGLKSGGMIIFENGTFTPYTEEDGLIYRAVNKVFKDTNGKIWVATDAGVSVFENGSFTNMEEFGHLPFWDITQDQNGDIWLGGETGAYLYDGKQVFNLNNSHGLPESSIRNILEDAGGNIWMGTQRSGVLRFKGSEIKTYNKNEWINSKPIAIITAMEKEGFFIGGYGNGLYKTTNGQVEKLIYHSNTFSPSFTGMIVNDENDFWLSTDQNGVIHYKQGKATLYDATNGLLSLLTYSLYKDKDNNIWAPAINGLNKIDSEGITQFPTKHGLNISTIWCVTEGDNGDIWFGTAGQGLYRFTGEYFIKYTKENGLPSNTVWAVSKDKHENLWFGTDAGLIRYDGTDFYNISKSSGLMDEVIYGTVFDSKGNMAVSTNMGVALLHGFSEGSTDSSQIILPSNNLSNEVLKKKTFLWKHYNINTGYPIKSINGGVNNHGAMDFDEQDILWLATSQKELISLDFSKVITNPNPPRVAVKNIKINKESIPWFSLKPDLLFKNLKFNDSTGKEYLLQDYLEQQEYLNIGEKLSAEVRDDLQKKYARLKFDSIIKWTSTPAGLILPYKDNEISFEIEAIETGQHQLVRYQYALLKGRVTSKINPSDWATVTEKNEAIFNNLFEGDYTFAARASNQDGIWSEPTLYFFKISPPWYRTWWMYLLYVTALISIVILIMRWRENALKRQNDLLEKQVQKRTHQLNVEKQKSDDLLKNILPEKVAEELKEKGSTAAQQFDNVTVLFTDFVNFTKTSEQLSPQQLVKELDECFTAFDRITEKHGLEKIKTVGDAYLAVCGLPTENSNHAQNTINAALEIRDFMIKRKEQENTFDIRIGIHSGSVVAGIVGVKKFAYDIWGDTVNTAARMEEHGEAGKVNISGDTHALVKEKYQCAYRGKVLAKNKGEMDMYFIEV